MTETTTKQHRVRIIQDPDASSPREDDNLGTIVAWHRNYALSDKDALNNQETPGEFFVRLAQTLEQEHTKYDTNPPRYDEDYQNLTDSHAISIIRAYAVMLPVFMYEHGGITISTGAFSDKWDSGQLGWIYCSHKKAKDEGIDLNKLEGYLQGEVKTYASFLEGDMYGFIVEECDKCESCDHEEWVEVQSCWGFYGSNVEENGMLEHIDEEYQEAAKKATPQLAMLLNKWYNKQHKGHNHESYTC